MSLKCLIGLLLVRFAILRVSEWGWGEGKQKWFGFATSVARLWHILNLLEKASLNYRPAACDKNTNSEVEIESSIWAYLFLQITLSIWLLSILLRARSSFPQIHSRGSGSLLPLILVPFGAAPPDAGDVGAPEYFPVMVPHRALFSNTLKGIAEVSDKFLRSWFSEFWL